MLCGKNHTKYSIHPHTAIYIHVHVYTLKYSYIPVQGHDNLLLFLSPHLYPSSLSYTGYVEGGRKGGAGKGGREGQGKERGKEGT